MWKRERVKASHLNIEYAPWRTGSYCGSHCWRGRGGWRSSAPSHPSSRWGTTSLDPSLLHSVSPGGDVPATGGGANRRAIADGTAWKVRGSSDNCKKRGESVMVFGKERRGITICRYGGETLGEGRGRGSLFTPLPRKEGIMMAGLGCRVMEGGEGGSEMGTGTIGKKSVDWTTGE